MALVLRNDDEEQSAHTIPVSLPYIDEAPSGALQRRVDALIAATARELPLPTTTPTYELQATPPPVPKKPRTALAVGVTSTGARGQLGVRFGAAAWKERCETAEKALAAMRRDVARRKDVLDGINKRRAIAQRACLGRLQRLQRRYWALVHENREVANALRE